LGPWLTAASPGELGNMDPSVAITDGYVTLYVALYVPQSVSDH
jgi:hypothetical protein